MVGEVVIAVIVAVLYNYYPYIVALIFVVICVEALVMLVMKGFQ